MCVCVCVCVCVCIKLLKPNYTFSYLNLNGERQCIYRSKHNHLFFYRSKKKKKLSHIFHLVISILRTLNLLFIKHSSLRILDSSTETPINLLNYLMLCITHSDSSLVASPLHLNVDQLANGIISCKPSWGTMAHVLAACGLNSPLPNTRSRPTKTACFPPSLCLPPH